METTLSYTSKTKFLSEENLLKQIEKLTGLSEEGAWETNAWNEWRNVVYGNYWSIPVSLYPHIGLLVNDYARCPSKNYFDRKSKQAGALTRRIQRSNLSNLESVCQWMLVAFFMYKDSPHPIFEFLLEPEVLINNKPRIIYFDE